MNVGPQQSADVEISVLGQQVGELSIRIAKQIAHSVKLQGEFQVRDAKVKELEEQLAKANARIKELEEKLAPPVAAPAGDAKPAETKPKAVPPAGDHVKPITEVAKS